MIDDANTLPQGTVLRADVCVVGAGPAGIALALALEGQGLQVLVLEAGRQPHDRPAQTLYEGDLANECHSPPHRYRLRGLGGSSGIWGGRCVPFDPIDFEMRPWVPYSGWPLTCADLLPHYEAANTLAEAGRCAYDAREALPDAPPLVAGFTSEIVHTHGLERFSCPTDFGRRYAQRLRLSRDIHVLQGAVCTAVQLDARVTQGPGPHTPAVQRVDGLSLATLEGNRLRAQARVVVLASGGLETARLLLCSNDVVPQGVGNRHDVVGRYYMCHLAGNLGTLVLHGPPSLVRHGYEVSAEGVYCRRRLAIAPAQQRAHGLLNAVARLHFPRIADPVHGSGVLSGLFLARRFIRYEYGRRLYDSGPLPPDAIARHVFNVARDGVATAAFLGHWLTRRTFATRKFPSVILTNRTNRFSLEVQGEQQPHPASRVTLSHRADDLGMRRLQIDWRYRPQDVDSVARTLALMADQFERSGVGHLQVDQHRLEDDLLRYGAYGGHHIGTTRMGGDPRTSVVDAHARVHDVDNLYIAGSAVFPTCSQANPTLTLLALTLRLASHLASRLGGKPRRAGTSAPAVALEVSP